MNTETRQKARKALVFYRETLATPEASPWADTDCPSCACAPQPSDMQSAAMAAAFAGAQTVA